MDFYNKMPEEKAGLSEESRSRELQRLEEELWLRACRPKTVKAYVGALRAYLREEGDVEMESMKRFVLAKLKEGKAPETVNVVLNALRFYRRYVLKRPGKLEVPFLRRNLKLPVVFTRSEVVWILEEISNSKHRLMLGLTYGAGLRVSEVVKLRVCDLRFEEGLLVIWDAKGGKDRLSLIPSRLVETLKTFCAGKEGGDWLFERALERRRKNTVFIKTGWGARATAQFCDASARAGHGPSLCAGTFGACESKNHSALHPCDELGTQSNS